MTFQFTLLTLHFEGITVSVISGQHGDVVVSTVNSQQAGSGSNLAAS